MKRPNLFTITAIAASLLAAPVVYAAPASIASPVHAMFGKTKLTNVTLSLRNDTSTEIQVSVGDNLMTLAPGKPISVTLPVGTRIIAKSSTTDHPAGSVIAEVISEQNGATISIR
jgi:hypothetical protein